MFGVVCVIAVSAYSLETVQILLREVNVDHTLQILEHHLHNQHHTKLEKKMYTVHIGIDLESVTVEREAETTPEPAAKG
jgi:hypothetical protein